MSKMIIFVIAYTIYNTHTVHTLHLIARTYHVMFTSIHLRFPHSTCDHVSQQVMITPDNVAYYAQLYTLVTKPALFSQDCQTIVYSFNIHFFGHCHIQRRLASGSINLRATAIYFLIFICGLDKDLPEKAL